MKTHKMKLVDFAFNKINNKEKDIELRLNDDKRKQINIGDIIEFEHIDTHEIIRTQVTNLYRYSTFKEIFNNFDFRRFGLENNDYNVMYSFYTKEEENKYGVLGIEIKLINF